MKRSHRWEWFWPFTISLPATILVWVFNSRFSFNLWDNFETFTPVTLTGHSLWLEGLIPILDIHQSLGLPIMGNAQSGILYFPFTLGLAVLRGFSVVDQNLPEAMGVFHLSVALAGWFGLIRAFDVRRDLALAVATGLVASGFYMVGAELWQHIGIEYGWFPWLLLALTKILTSTRPRNWTLAFAGFWFLCAAGSHVQQLIYIVIHLFLFALVLVVSQKDRYHALARVWLPLAWIPILSAPVLCYSLAIRAVTQRSGALPPEVFFEASLSPKFILGLFTPFYDTRQILFGTSLSFFTFAGPWVLLCGLSWFQRRRPVVWGLALLALLFLDFSLGEKGLIYPMTRWIPVWSSFRWPYKFTLHWVSMLSLLAAIMWEDEWPKLQRHWRLGLAVTVWVLPLSFALPNSLAAWVLWGAIGGIGLSSLFPRWPMVISCLVYFAAALWLSTEQGAHRYPERYGSYGAEYFGLKDVNKNRLVPLSFPECVGSECAMQPYSAFDSAAMNGYLSLSGHQMGMSAQSFNAIVSGNAWGIVQPPTAMMAMGRGLYRSLAVRYYLVADRDLSIYSSLLQERHLSLSKKGPGWSVFEDSAALDLVNVPSRVIGIGENWPGELFGTAEPGPFVSYVQGLMVDREQSPQIKVTSTEWREGRGLSFNVDNPTAVSAYVQVSLFPWPFMKAHTDLGQSLSTFASNGVATVVEVPPGQNRIHLWADAKPFWLSLMLAVAAFAAGAWWTRRLYPKS